MLLKPRGWSTPPSPMRQLAERFPGSSPFGRVPDTSIQYGTPLHARRIIVRDCPLLEVHVGVRVAGKSGVLHECDIAVIERGEAESCRQNGTEPRSFHLKIAVEAKFYSANLGLDLARSFIGLTRDLAPSASPCFVANITSASVVRLLGARTREWQDEVVPESNGARRLRAFFENQFHRYCVG